jgi:hypothetical protein
MIIMTGVGTPTILVNIIDPTLNLIITFHIIIALVVYANDLSDKRVNGFPQG